jgi:hypothetical protein
MISHSINQKSDEKKAQAFIDNACKSEYKDPWKFFSIPFLRPEDIPRYVFVTEFKLSTRTLSTSQIIKILKAYITGLKGERYKGNLVELLDTHGMKEVVKEVPNEKVPDDYYKYIHEPDYCKELFSKIGKIHRTVN